MSFFLYFIKYLNIIKSVEVPLPDSYFLFTVKNQMTTKSYVENQTAINPLCILNDYCETMENDKDRIYRYLELKGYEWILIQLCIIIFVVGLSRNFLIKYCVWKNPNMRTVTNYFLVNLAAAGSLVVLFCLAITVVINFTET